MTDKDSKMWYLVNKELVLIKAHYFFLFGGMAGTVTFMPVLAKELGFHATAVGIVYTLLPFCIFLAKFLFGYITDLFRNIKLLMVILAIATTIMFMLVLLIPALDTEPANNIRVKAICINDSSQLVIKLLNSNSPCLNESIPTESWCYLTSRECLNDTELKTLVGTLTRTNFIFSEFKSDNGTGCGTYRFIFNKTNAFSIQNKCDCLETKFSIMDCSFNTSIDPSIIKFESTSSVYSTYNYWLFLILSIFSGSGAAASFCLSDAACYELLGEHPKLYGRQRLWGTVSWGIVTLLAGYFNDLATGESVRTDYSPGFYIMLILMTVDLIILNRFYLVKTKISLSICEDVRKMFMSYEIILFSIAVFVCGAMTGLIWNYQFWYLQDLGASQTLLGLVIAVQCLATEVPFFFCSGWLITKIGYFHCMTGIFIGYFLRTGLYAILKDPWVVLPVELFHGITFALFYATMTTYAANAAPSGTEVTMLGVLEGFYEGLGVAAGSLLGGVGFDQIGGRLTFFTASMISLICAPLFAITFYVINRVPDKTSFQRLETLNGMDKDYGSGNLCEMSERK